MNKILIVGVFLLSLVGLVSAYSVVWSQGYEPTQTPFNKNIKTDCLRDEWNNNFEDYRAGILPKEYMINYVRSCKW